MNSHKLCQFIVKKYIKTNINWAKEIKIAQKLTKEYKGYDFWNNLNSIKLNSLAWFFTEDGKAFIKLELKKQDLKEFKKDTFAMEPSKVGQDKTFNKKPKSILEFIRK